MFARLLVCAGFLVCLCFGLVGCEDEGPQIVKEVAELVETVPASGERAAAHQPVVIYFDKAPLAVAVNGTAARVAGNSAIWYFPTPPSYGDGLFHIEWTNPDGTPNVGTSIRLTVSHGEPSELSITSGNVWDGAADVDPDLLNRNGIHFDFDEPTIDVQSQLLTEDGEDLGWETVWDDQTVIFRLGANGDLLEHGRGYLIRLVVAEAWTYSEIWCECIDCSLYGNSEWTIGFITADE